MIIIADSGSTKTDWAIIQNGQISYSKTEGIQPRLMTVKQIAEIAKQLSVDIQENCTVSIYFYGTGCSHKSSRDKIQSALADVYRDASIEIQTDLEGAAIGMFGNASGIIGILGTGCNCGYWNGNAITSKPLSAGYLLGDEGSGYYIGKLLIESYIKNNMPADVASEFQTWTTTSPSALVEKIYQQENPSRFIAKHALFASTLPSNDFINALLTENFDLFFRDYITKIKEFNTLHIKLIGSIATAFEKHIKNSAWKYGCAVSAVANDSIEKLAQYHKRQETLC